MFEFIQKYLFWNTQPVPQVCIPNQEPLNIDSEFDIEGKDVYSIERQIIDDRVVTTIAFYEKSGQAIEWNIQTDNHTHIDYVNRLRAKLNKKNNKQVVVIVNHPSDCISKSNDDIIILDGSVCDVKHLFFSLLTIATQQKEYTFKIGNVTYLTESFFDFSTNTLYNETKLPKFYDLDEWILSHKVKI